MAKLKKSEILQMERELENQLNDDGTTDIKCGGCEAILGTENVTDIYPITGMDVQIQEGYIKFQCPVCGEYKVVRKNEPGITLFRPGAKRIY